MVLLAHTLSFVMAITPQTFLFFVANTVFIDIVCGLCLLFQNHFFNQILKAILLAETHQCTLHCFSFDTCVKYSS